MNILFIFDRVAHYHRPLFKKLDRTLSQGGHRLGLLSGYPGQKESGRVGIAQPVIDNQRTYNFYEINVASYTLRYQRNVVAQISDLKPDIVVVPSHAGNLTSWILGKRSRRIGYRLFSWQCGYEYHRHWLKRAVVRNYLRLFDYHLAYHSNAKRYLLEHGIEESKISVIFNTIDESLIRRTEHEEARHRLSARHPEIKGKKVILFVGAILAEKRLEILVKAFRGLNRADACLVIVGDGPHLQTVKDYAKGMANIVFAGRVIDDVGYYFDASHVFVLPGTGGLAINEAMAHGVPVISGYADGSADDLVVDDKTGYRLRTNSAREIAERLTLLLDDEALRLKLAGNAGDLIHGKYSFSNFVSRVEAALLSRDVNCPGPSKNWLV